MAVASCPPPGVPVETNTPANLPAKAPLAQSPPVASQKAYHGDQIVENDSMAKSYLPLCREVTVTSGDTKEECVKLCQLVDRDDWIIGFRRCMHFGKHFIWEGLWDSRWGNCPMSDRRLYRKGWTYW